MARPPGYKIDKEALGEILAERRLTLTEFADLVELDVNTLGRYIAGDRGASMGAIRSIEAVIGDASRLFPDLPPKAPTP